MNQRQSCDWGTGARPVNVTFRRNPRTGVDITYKERPPGYSIPPERHGFWEFVYVDHGLLRVHLNGQETALRQGQYMFIRPGAWHAVRPSCGEATFYVTAHFETDCAALFGIGCRVLSGDSESRRLVSEILKERQSALPGAYDLARCYMIELITKSMRRLTASDSSASLGTYFQQNHERNLVESVLAWMRDHLSEALNLNSIARAARVSPSHLAHIFKKATGRPVMSSLVSLRIERAKQLLLESGLNVSQIAEQTGFSSVYVFSRSFKKHVSLAPSQYARMVQRPHGAVPAGRIRTVATTPVKNQAAVVKHSVCGS